MRLGILLILLLNYSLWGRAQCDPLGTVQSDRVADYTFDVVLDHEQHLATARSTIIWRNPSPDPVDELQLYMYLNAFKNQQSSWLKGAGGRVFGQALDDRDADEWGYVEIDRMTSGAGYDMLAQARFIQELDGNEDDETVLLVPLDKPVAAGDSLIISLEFRSKLPKTIARSGYGANDFHLFVHWYPKLGVYEKDQDGDWGWNCHQFVQRTEFYGDFGRYECTVRHSDHLIFGASGCQTSEQKHQDGTISHTYIAEDVIDFAWTVSPEFEVHESHWNDTFIKLLIPSDHCHMAERYMDAIRWSLDYFDEHLGRYPYPSIILVDPPFHSLRNGFMEYPTLITAGTIYRMPKWFHGSESLAVHEFAHQYFMAILASNEKEEAWLDEGFVTYYEDRIMEHYYGEKTSQIDLLGYQYGNGQLSRQEYVSIPDGTNTAIARPGWEITGSYKGIVYAKAATMLTTLERYMGLEDFDRMVRMYYEQHKFSHPRKEDFLTVLTKYLEVHFSSAQRDELLRFIDLCLHTSGTVDLKVASVSGSTAVLERQGDLSLSVSYEINLADGSIQNGIWNSSQYKLEISYDSDILSIYIDPDQMLYMDQNLSNNIWKRDTQPFYRNIVKATSWMSQFLQSSSFLF